MCFDNGWFAALLTILDQFGTLHLSVSATPVEIQKGRTRCGSARVQFLCSVLMEGVLVRLMRDACDGRVVAGSADRCLK